MDRRSFIVRSAGALAKVGLGGSVVAKQLETRHGKQASVNPSAGEREMATREEMFVRYSDSVETLQAGKAETVDQITATLLNIAKKVGDRQRHTVRGVHAKSHGLLKAEVIVPSDLREELRQGLFANAGSYGAVMRFSTNPGVATVGLLSALSVMPLAAQIDNGVVFTAPFSFYAGNVELPAGSYKVTHLDMTTKMVLVRNIASMNGVVVNVTVKSSVNPFKETDVTFDKYGDTGYLRGVSVARETDGLEFGRSNAETKAAATATKAENTKVVEHAALMRGK